MHRHNNKYGHGIVLRRYCDLSEASPILGEVQHSLFLSTHHFNASHVVGPARQTASKLSPLFSWNTLLPFGHQEPIGDPLWYDTVRKRVRRERPCPSSDKQSNSLPLVMPKLNDGLTPTERLADYTRLIHMAQKVSTSNRVIVSLHPRDQALYTAISEATGAIPSARSDGLTDPLELNRISLKEMATSSLVISDYFGAHVFRAVSMCDTPVMVDIERAFHRAIHPNFRDVLWQFVSAEPGSNQQKEISDHILGKQHVLEPEELRQLLFRPGVPPLQRRVWVAGYKASRRLGVRFRQSPLWGRSRVAKWWELKVLRPRWEAKFPPIEQTLAKSPPARPTSEQ